MGLVTDLTQVPGHLFQPSGKWKYEVWLDYTGILDEEGKAPDGRYHPPHESALAALRQATEKGTSGSDSADPGHLSLGGG